MNTVDSIIARRIIDAPIDAVVDLAKRGIYIKTRATPWDFTAELHLRWHEEWSNVANLPHGDSGHA